MSGNKGNTELQFRQGQAAMAEYCVKYDKNKTVKNNYKIIHRQAAYICHMYSRLWYTSKQR